VVGCGGPAETGPSPDAEHADAIAHWTCPMHPDVQEAKQVPCGLCGMDLVAVHHSDLESGAVLIDPMRRQKYGISTTVLEERDRQVRIHGPGWVTWDENLVRDITAQSDLFIEAYHVGGAGGAVDEGEPLVTLKLAGGSRKTVVAPFDGVVVSRDLAAGAFLEKGDRILRVGSIERVWVEAELHEDDLPFAMPDMHGIVRIARWPQDQGTREILPKMYKGLITQRLPGLDPMTRRGRVRMEMDNPSDVLMPGLGVDVEFKGVLAGTLAVPREAVVHAGPRRIVFVEDGEQLIPKDIEIGRSFDQWIEVDAGLEAGDKVVVSGTFLVAAESRLRAASTFWAATADGD